MFKPKELRVCNQCGLVMTEKEMKKHSLATGHVSFSIVRISLEELFKRVLELEVEAKKLDKRIEKLEELIFRKKKKVEE